MSLLSCETISGNDALVINALTDQDMSALPTALNARLKAVCFGEKKVLSV